MVNTWPVTSDKWQVPWPCTLEQSPPVSQYVQYFKEVAIPKGLEPDGLIVSLSPSPGYFYHILLDLNISKLTILPRCASLLPLENIARCVCFFYLHCIYSSFYENQIYRVWVSFHVMKRQKTKQGNRTTDALEQKNHKVNGALWLNYHNDHARAKILALLSKRWVYALHQPFK